MGAMSGVSPQTIWNRPVRGTRGPHRELSHDQIAAAAIELADAGGLRSVTMRAVAEALGISAAGLYRYVGSRDELIALMVDAALADMTLPIPNGDWETQLLAVARELLGVYIAHTWLGEAAYRSGPAGPNALRYFDQCLAIMAALPASAATKMESLAMLTGVVSLFARAAASQPPDPAILFAALDPQAHPNLTAALTAPDQPERQPDLFQRTLTSVLSGLLKPPDSGGPARPAE
jgi:AcrR family transcriptional regulator